VSGFAAYLLLPGMRQRLERAQADPRIAPELLAECRVQVAGVAAAADAWIASRVSVDGRSEVVVTEMVSGSGQMSTAEAATVLGVTPRRVVQLLADGTLEGERAGRVWLVDRASVQDHATFRRAR